MTNDIAMKKSTKKYIPEIKEGMISEPNNIYQMTPNSNKIQVLVKNFTYKDFKKILEKGPFTMGEWADLLFISERTLHRYAKEDSGFNGLQIERILLLETLIDMGNDLFGKEGFKIWLQSKPFSLHGNVVKDELNTHHGIQDVIDLLGRLQHGISA